jgi:hypothetical protein
MAMDRPTAPSLPQQMRLLASLTLAPETASSNSGAPQWQADDGAPTSVRSRAPQLAKTALQVLLNLHPQVLARALP